MDIKLFIKQNLDHFNTRLKFTLRDLSTEELAWRPNSEANSIGYVIWHTTRVEDRMVNKMATDGKEIWTSDGWFQRLGLQEKDTGINYTKEQLDKFPALTRENLWGYLDVVRQRTNEHVDSLAPDDFDTILDRDPFPEVEGSDKYFDGCTGYRMFVILIGEHFQHLGHAAYIRGLQKGLDQ